MSSRLSGAVLALAAAALLAISIATSAWWAGHPVSPTRTYTQIAHVGLHGAKLCLVDEAQLETCKDAPTQSVFGPVGWIELVACGLLVVSALALGVMTLRRSEERKTFALLVIGGAPLADVLAFALIAIGPTSEARIPYGYGLYLFFIGSTMAIAGAVLARRAIPALVIPVPLPAPVPMPISQQLGVDMAALMRDDPMRPSSPEPMLGGRQVSTSAPPPSPGGNLPGFAGPLGAPRSPAEAPLFQSAPQLRPLYEVQGTSPVAPPPKLPPRAPTPLPREKIAAQTGMAEPQRLRFAPPEKPQPNPVTKPPPFSKPPITWTMPVEPPPAHVAPTTPPPLDSATPTPEPRPDQTDPSGFATVGDATDVNVAVLTPAPQVDPSAATMLEAPATEEVPLRGSTEDDNAETLAVEKVSATDLVALKAPEKTPTPAPVVEKPPEKPVDKPKIVSTAPDSLPPPIESKRAQTASPSPACPQCESPMAWVEEHLRFYCKSCRMYF